MQAENRGQMVRGCIVAGSHRAGCIGLTEAKDDANWDVILAHTTWYRHDDNLAELDLELDKLRAVYLSFSHIDSLMMSYEYQDYRA